MTRILGPLALLTATLAFVLVACGGNDDDPPPAPTVAPTTTAAPAVAPTSPPAVAPTSPPVATPTTGPRVVKVLNKDQGGSGVYAFDPADLTFKVGETITLEVTAETEFHTFTVDDQGIDEEVSGGETVTITHTFDKAGTFMLICIPHQALGMTGTITVTP